MKKDHRKGQRLSEFMPVSVFIKNSEGDILAGPIAGRIVDICPGGAGLLLAQIQSGAWHLFHSPRQDRSLSLHLVVNHPEQELNLTLTARPVWLNTFENEQFREQIMGVTFLDSDREA